jgi:8-oxo-dGTP pyrophosphatase MutT (NUDIX family)
VTAAGAAAGPTQPAAAKPASTIVVLRDAAHGAPELLLVQRHGGMGFMGGMHVFPGGKVASSDASLAMRAQTHDRGVCVAGHSWGEGIAEEDAFARAVAAVRETFEEACMLFAPRSAGLAALRAELLGGTELAALLAREGLMIQLTALQPLSRWITPESEPVRFDTTFYVARAPEGQEPSHDATEAVAASWFTAESALAAAAEGRIRLAPPTARTIEGLLEARCVDDALASARQRPPPVILPILRADGDGMVVLYPGDPDHPVRERALPGETRVVWRRPAPR